MKNVTRYAYPTDQIRGNLVEDEQGPFCMFEDYEALAKDRELLANILAHLGPRERTLRAAAKAFADKVEHWDTAPIRWGTRREYEAERKALRAALAAAPGREERNG